MKQKTKEKCKKRGKEELLGSSVINVDGNGHPLRIRIQLRPRNSLVSHDKRRIRRFNDESRRENEDRARDGDDRRR